jgi:hypothetical protein
VLRRLVNTAQRFTNGGPSSWQSIPIVSEPSRPATFPTPTVEAGGAPELEASSPSGLAPYGVAKGGGLRVATQLVSGASGRRRNEAMTDWAHGDSGATKCPTPGMLAILELGSVSATA